jgi:hypothetical protein
MATPAIALISHLTSFMRDSFPEMSAAVGITIVITNHDPRGTTRNGKASLDPGDVETTVP